jgi:alginate O-acetyltransferase complex protein AlgI
LLGLGIGANLVLLGTFKYANYVVDLINVGASERVLQLAPIALPVGISFFTFHSMSYLIDVHRGVARAQESPVRLALYIVLFPQLIAGPIVRYGHVAGQLLTRPRTRSDFALGVRRFVIGLGKKVLIADNLSPVAGRAFDVDVTAPDPTLAWLGALCFMAQIYFDFSGYSDMAIGLARMFGFEFRENFEHPYESRSIVEFWRRWHISLSSWFRDYLYIPLGGNRGSPLRNALNLWIVFLLCGLWHGAATNFVAWGLYHGGFLVLERTRFGRVLAALPGFVAQTYTLLVVLVGWVLFTYLLGIGDKDKFDLGGIIGAIIGTMLVLLALRMLRRSRGTGPRAATR